MVVNYKGLGRRKKSVARVLLAPGSGKITINTKVAGRGQDKYVGRDIKVYFPSELVIQEVVQPLVVTNTKEIMDVEVRVNGGGYAGQAGAIKLAIARALVELNEDNKQILRQYGLLTRDARVKERKKYGLYGARRAPQFTKR